MTVRCQITAILIFSIAWCSVCIACELEDVAVYKLRLYANWNGNSFIKLSQVFGQSHNISYALYHIGDESKPSVREFVKTGDLENLTEEGNEEPKVYDQFDASVEDGVQETESVIFVDGSHSLVSLISRVTPSSGWFVGVDSLDLCINFHSAWIEEITLDLELLTEETDLTEQDNPSVVEKVNIRHIGYKNNPKLIYPLAKVEFKKVREYTSQELNNLARKQLMGKVRYINEDNFHHITTKNPFEQLKDLEEKPLGTPRPNNPDNNVIVATKAPEFSVSKDLSSQLENMDDAILAIANGKKLGLGRHLPRHFKSRLHHAVNKHRRHVVEGHDMTSWYL